MSARHPKGSKRPDPTVKRHQRPGHGTYELAGGIPWPTLGDGSPYAEGCGWDMRVRHRDHPQEVGKLQWVEWCHPDGTRMADAERETVKKATKTLPERRTTNPGAWYAVVSWDRRDQMDSMMARHPLENLTRETPDL